MERAEGANPLVDHWKRKEHRRIYISAGTFIGKTEYIKSCLDRLKEFYVQLYDVVERPQDDQGWWYHAITDGAVDTAIDYEARLVIMTKYTPWDWYKLSPGKCELKPNGAVPCIMHFAGVEDTLDRMPKFYKELFPDARG